MSSDVERLRRDVSLPDTAARFGIKLQKDGREWVAVCPMPNHVEDTPSFTIFRGKDSIERFHCFGCGAHGDVLDLTQSVKGVDLRGAISILGGAKAGPNIAQVNTVVARDVYAGITPLDPPRDLEHGQRVRLYNPKRADDPKRAWGSFVPTLIHPYCRADGSLFGYVLRHDLGGGDKETPMVMWVRLPDGDECWSRFPFPKPRPLYGLETLRDARQVIVVEGEKCRDALANATARTVVSWAGGTQGVKHTDWSPLAGRNVVIWPDFDGPGISTANEVAEIVTSLNATARIMQIKAA